MRRFTFVAVAPGSAVAFLVGLILAGGGPAGLRRLVEFPLLAA